jgi:2TM family of unknown function (DUF5676)
VQNFYGGASSWSSDEKGRAMLNPVAFASSLTIFTGAFYLLLYLLAVVWREAFRFLFNAQFLGADVASLLPRDLSVGGFVSTFIAIIVFVWLFGYAWGRLYNGLARGT